MKLKKKTGYTLVEVIVISVIVAILALIALPIYTAHANDSAKNTASNVACSAASFLAAARNSAQDWKQPGNLDGNDNAKKKWAFKTSSGDTVYWTCPPNAKITVNINSLTATIKEQESVSYFF